MHSSPLSTITRLGVAVIFLAAAPQKILAPAAFAQNVLSYQILPDLGLNFTALVLPWLEMVVAILLLCSVALIENNGCFAFLDRKLPPVTLDLSYRKTLCCVRFEFASGYYDKDVI